MPARPRVDDRHGGSVTHRVGGTFGRGARAALPAAADALVVMDTGPCRTSHRSTSRSLGVPPPNDLRCTPNGVLADEEACVGWVWITVVAWVLLAVIAAVLLGRTIHRADLREPGRRGDPT